MEKFFETNKKTILTLAGIGAATALIALVFKNVKKTKAEKETPVPVRKESTSHLFGLTKEEKASAIGSINIEYEGHHLSTRTMQQIIDAIRIFAQPKYLELVKENRLNRRAKKDALEQYIACWYDFNTKVDEIIAKSEKEILREINVPEAVYNDSTEYHKNKQDNEIALARVFLQSKLKGEQKSTKTISLEEVREILKSQIEFTKKEAENREFIAGKLNNPVETAPLIGTQILDHLHSKYTVEEEDIQAALLVHGADAHVQELSMELQSAILMLTADEPSQPEQ